LVRASLQENNTIENMERIFKAAKAQGFEVFISPHYFYPTDKGWKLNGPLRKRKISKIILGGMLANMCVESHLRELLEQGFEVAVVKDATAAPKHPEWGYGYEAALINYAFLAHAILTTDEVVQAIEHGRQ
jgi:isochorismate hydrolase